MLKPSVPSDLRSSHPLLKRMEGLNAAALGPPLRDFDGRWSQPQVPRERQRAKVSASCVSPHGNCTETPEPFCKHASAHSNCWGVPWDKEGPFCASRPLPAPPFSSQHISLPWGSLPGDGCTLLVCQTSLRKAPVPEAISLPFVRQAQCLGVECSDLGDF